MSGRLSEFTFEEIKEAARVVRGIAPVSRVIAGGGYAKLPLPNYIRSGDDGTLGVDMPATEFFQNRLEVVHMGAEVDHQHQLPQIAVSHGADVHLVGKAADILVTDDKVSRFPCVDSGENLEHSSTCIRNARSNNGRNTLTVTNILETDLAGHQQDPARYIEVVEQFDEWLGAELAELGLDDLFVITGDHGNDPLIGHSLHTREYVPIIAAQASSDSGCHVREAEPFQSLADLGASCAALFGVAPSMIGNGHVRDLV